MPYDDCVTVRDILRRCGCATGRTPLAGHGAARRTRKLWKMGLGLRGSRLGADLPTSRDTWSNAGALLRCRRLRSATETAWHLPLLLTPGPERPRRASEVPGKSRFTLGSRMNSIRIRRLERGTWMVIGTACAGRIESVVELHQGRLSDYVAEVVTDRGSGGFAQPGDIVASCVMRMSRHDHDVQSMRQPRRPKSAAGWTSVRSSLRASRRRRDRAAWRRSWTRRGGGPVVSNPARRRAAASKATDLTSLTHPHPRGRERLPRASRCRPARRQPSRHVEKTLTYRPPSATSDRLACRLRVDVSRRVKVFRSEPDSRAARAERVSERVRTDCQRGGPRSCSAKSVKRYAGWSSRSSCAGTGRTIRAWSIAAAASFDAAHQCVDCQRDRGIEHDSCSCRDFLRFTGERTRWRTTGCRARRLPAAVRPLSAWPNPPRAARPGSR